MNTNQKDLPKSKKFITSALPSDILNKRNFLSEKPSPIILEGQCVRLEPLIIERDAQTLLVQKTSANTETTYLMLKHCFELGYRRVEWKCHSLNERSRRAALRMGFKFEGIQESHMIVKDCNRDTAWFRILNYEWPKVKQDLEIFLYNK